MSNHQCPGLLMALCLGILASTSSLAAEDAAVDNPESEPNEQRLLGNIRQLIFEGARSGEGYFSADGSKMIFQSEREPGNPFYQMYLMDLDTGDSLRVSPGVGKTTCGWIHPSGKRVLFASSHADPQAHAKQQEELDKRAAGQASRYSWSFDEHYDIYEADTEGNNLRNLTEVPGYDAEGSWSPDGSQIVFASNRHAYATDLPPAEQRIFARDPSYFMEIYIMNADGSNVRRLTEAPGYDGGPFFSPDGRKIVWRRFAKAGATAEVWTMRVDGTEQRPITDLGVMSWAPFYHPSGDYIIFANNAQGMSNFELYLIDSAGRSQPVRVTYSEGFDGLPVFSPDGQRLAWSSKRTAERKAQIFIADWNDQAARILLGLIEPASDNAKPVPASTSQVPDLGRTTPAIRAEELRLHVNYLASESLGGRLTGTAGERLATEYVASVFDSLGLQPAGDDNGFFQVFEFTAGVSLSPGNRLVLHTQSDPHAFAVDVDWRPLAFSQAGEVDAAEIVFAGYGIVAPASEEFPAYNAYAGLDVKDKWVMMFRYLPEDITPEHRQYLSNYFELRYKAMIARDQGARGLILVSGPNSQVKDQLVKLRTDTALASTSIAAISITDESANRLLAASGKTVKGLQDLLDQGEAMPGFVLPGVQLEATIRLRQEKRKGRNVLARLIAGDQPAASAVAIGAHVDHIGHGEVGDSLAGQDEAGQIHPGADDNASGVAGLLEIAQYLTDQKARGQLALRRDVLFAAWSGEEIGLLGSGHFANSLGKNAETQEIIAYLNMDMIGRLDQRLTLQGAGSSSIWPQEIERRNAPLGLPITVHTDSYLPTDATSFYLKQVPVLSAFTGAHEDYNTPRDTADKLNYEGASKIARLMGLITRSLALRAEEPDYVATQRPTGSPSRRNLRAYLGTIPEYADSEPPGVKLNGVAKGSPAAQGGLRAGDVIVELAGRTIENVYDYTYALNALKVGQPAQIVVHRAGETVALTVTPGSRE